MACLCSLVACEQQVPETAAPNLILLNGHVVTMDTGDTVAQAVAVSDNTITAVGTTTEISKLAGPDTEIIDLGGRTVTPGLIDTHNHFAWGALGEIDSLNLSYPNVESISDVREKIRQAVAHTDPGEWIIGSNWDAGKFSEQRDITAADLDDVAPDNPVWLLHTSAHYGVANSRALDIARIDIDTPAPDGGVIERDEDGVPTGILSDQAMALISSVTPETTSADFIEAITAQVGSLNAEGITTIKDPEIDQRHWMRTRRYAPMVTFLSGSSRCGADPTRSKTRRSCLRTLRPSLIPGTVRRIG